MALPDFFRLALRARIESADHALQFGEFLDQFGGEIALGRRAARWACSSPPSVSHQLHHALGLLQIRSQLGLEGDMGQIFHAVRQLLR